jgi:hypothetical protein
MATRSKGIAVVGTDSRRSQDQHTGQLEASDAAARFVAAGSVAYAFRRPRLGSRRQKTAVGWSTFRSRRVR